MGPTHDSVSDLIKEVSRDKNLRNVLKTEYFVSPSTFRAHPKDVEIQE